MPNAQCSTLFVPMTDGVVHDLAEDADEFI
jgi:hypothetical protein